MGTPGAPASGLSRSGASTQGCALGWLGTGPWPSGGTVRELTLWAGPPGLIPDTLHYCVPYFGFAVLGSPSGGCSESFYNWLVWNG
jgi:hypothetical protein